MVEEQTSIPIRSTFARAEAEEPIHKVIQYLREYTEIHVFKGKEYLGVITSTLLTRKGRFPPQTKLENLLKPVNPLTTDLSINEIAHRLLSNKVHSIPVIEKGKTLGVYHSGDVIKAFFKTKKDAITLYKTDKIVTVREQEPVSLAIKLFRDHNISRVPVVNDKNEVVGTINARDIVVRFFNAYANEHIFEPEGIEDTPYNTKCEDIMTEPLPILPENTPISQAINVFNEKNITAVIVGKPNNLEGIVTLTDLLEPLTVPPETHGYYFNIVGDDIDELDIQNIIGDVLKVIKRYAEFIGMNGHVVVHVKAFPKKKFRTHILYQSRIRVNTEKGFMFHAKGEGYGIIGSLSIALEHLDREMLSRKETSQKSKKYVEEFIEF